MILDLFKITQAVKSLLSDGTSNGTEVEYGITAPDWAAIPLEAETEEVIRDGMLVLFERGNVLSRHTRT